MDLTASFPPVVSAYMQSDARHRMILGPFGSGKSVGSMFDIPRRAAMQEKAIVMKDGVPERTGLRKTRFAIVRNTMPQLRDTTMKTWFDWFPNGSLGFYKETGKTYFIRHNDIDCEVVFRALDDAADVKNLLSLELTGAYVNEFRDILREIMEALDGRIGRYPRMNEGGPTWMGIWGDSNMPEEDSYYYRMEKQKDPDTGKLDQPNNWQFFIQPPGMLKQVDGTYIENPLAENYQNLPKGYYKNLADGKTDDFIRTFVLCEYGRSRGGLPVHPTFNRDIHVSKTPIPPNKNNLLLISCDFGLTPAVVLKQQNAFGQVLTLDEIVEFGMGIERLILDKLLPLLARKYDGFEIFVTGDPSGNKGSEADETSCADIFKRYKNKGLGKVKFAWSNSPVHRQGATDHFLTRLVDAGRPAYLVDGGNCPWLVQALGGKFSFKKTKDGRNSDEVDKNNWSHVGEANQYGDMYFERGGRRKAEHKERGTGAVAATPNAYASPR